MKPEIGSFDKINKILARQIKENRKKQIPGIRNEREGITKDSSELKD